MKRGSNKFIQGYVCAIVNIINQHGHNTHTKEGFECLGNVTALSLKQAGCEQSDIDTLKKHKLI